jgi:predicted transcriptional regulator of viral defense system
MSYKTHKLIGLFKKANGVLRFSTIIKAGFHPDTLVSLVKDGTVEKIGRGLYKLRQDQEFSNPDLVIAALKVPRGVICLLSALAFHEASDEIPHSIDIAIPRGARAFKIEYPPIRYYRFNSESWKHGIEEHTIDGHTIRVYSLAKTVADCFKFRNKIGMPIARDALKVAIMEKHVSPKEVMRFAKICRVANIMKPILETIL